MCERLNTDFRGFNNGLLSKNSVFDTEFLHSRPLANPSTVVNNGAGKATELRQKDKTSMQCVICSCNLLLINDHLFSAG